MPYAARSLSRNRGRPKGDDTLLVDLTLLLWLTECPDLSQRELYWAVSRIAKANHMSARCGEERLRRRLNNDLRKLDDEDRLRRAIAVAEQRGKAVPSRARERLALLEEQRGAMVRELAARITALLPRAPRLPISSCKFATTPLFDCSAPLRRRSLHWGASQAWRAMLLPNLIALSNEMERYAAFYRPFRTPERDRLPVRHARQLFKLIEAEFDKLTAQNDVEK